MKLLVVAVLLLVGCVPKTLVRFETNEPGADVFIDHVNIGKTPVSTEMSNGIWNDPIVQIKKPGYRTINTEIKKALKGANLAIGLFFWAPTLLWVYGPAKIQYYDLTSQ